MVAQNCIISKRIQQPKDYKINTPTFELLEDGAESVLYKPPQTPRIHVGLVGLSVSQKRVRRPNACKSDTIIHSWETRRTYRSPIPTQSIR